jgi:hypothetical protein
MSCYCERSLAVIVPSRAALRLGHHMAQRDGYSHDATVTRWQPDCRPATYDEFVIRAGTMTASERAQFQDIR